MPQSALPGCDQRATATSTWECRSSAFPAPVTGRDTYEFDDAGLISRLHVEIVGRDA